MDTPAPRVVSTAFLNKIGIPTVIGLGLRTHITYKGRLYQKVYRRQVYRLMNGAGSDYAR